MKKDDSIYLKHILDAIIRIEKYTRIKKRKDFLKDKLVQDGVIRQLEIIGEAAKRVSIKLRNKYSNIPWKDITGTRDKLINDFFGVDINAVWDTVQNDIPGLKHGLKKIIVEEEEV